MNYVLIFVLFAVILACYFGGLILCVIAPAPRVAGATCVLVGLYVVGFSSLAALGNLALRLLEGAK